MAQEAAPKTAKVMLYELLQELSGDQFKEFKFRLKEYPVQAGKSNIPDGILKEADRMVTAELLINYYEDRSALEITANLLRQISRLDLLEEFQHASKTRIKGRARKHTLSKAKRMRKQLFQDSSSN